jgi:hypothetical protein
MAKAKKIVRREWTKDDVRQMKSMAKAKAGVKKIAKALKRTPGATSAMATKLGVSLSTRGWTAPMETGWPRHHHATSPFHLRSAARDVAASCEDFAYSKCGCM